MIAFTIIHIITVPPWEAVKSLSTWGETYFHNVLTGDTTYERPTEPADYDV